MAIFVYKGVTAAGGQVRGEIQAQDARAAARQLRQQRITVTTVAPKTAAAQFTIPFLGGVSTKEISVFTRQFSTMIGAGLPLVQCLQALGSQAERKRFQEIIARVASDVEGGATLSEAMARHPKIFDDLYVNLVQVGEVGGVLDTMLARLSIYMEKAAALRHRVQMAMIYPILVITVAILVVAFLLMFVIPVFAAFYTKAGVPLPLPTRIVLGLSGFLLSFWWLVLIGFGGGMFLFRYWYATEAGRTTVDGFLLKAPIFGPLIRKISVARFTRTLSALLGGGVPIIEALKITAKTSGNRIIENAVMEARERVTAGQTLVEPLKASGVFPPMVVQMVAVGEQTGALDNMLAKVADYYEDEVDVAVSGLTALLEPILIVFLGVVIGGIVISIYLPIFQIVTLI